MKKTLLSIVTIMLASPGFARIVSIQINGFETIECFEEVRHDSDSFIRIDVMECRSNHNFTDGRLTLFHDVDSTNTRILEAGSLYFTDDYYAGPAKCFELIGPVAGKIEEHRGVTMLTVKKYNRCA